MNRRTGIAVLLGGTAAFGLAQLRPTEAQNTPVAPTPGAFCVTGAPETSRYALAASSSEAASVLRLDKFTGEVERLAPRSDGTGTWQTVRRDRNAQDNRSGDYRPAYQLFASPRGMILLNVVTGATWMLVGGSGEEMVFKAFE